MAIYPKHGHKLLYTPMTGEIKCLIGYTFALCIPFHLLQCRCNTCTNMINNDMIHFISSCDHIGSSILTSLALHRCFGPSATSHHSTCPSHLQQIHRAKSCLDLLHLSHMTPCYVLYAMSSFITCVSFTTFPNQFTSMAYVAHTCVLVD
jgi:hypothetical protein